MEEEIKPNAQASRHRLAYRSVQINHEINLTVLSGHLNSCHIIYSIICGILAPE